MSRPDEYANSEQALRLIRVTDQLNPLLADDRAKRLPILAAMPTALIGEISQVGRFSSETSSALCALGAQTQSGVDEQFLKLASEVREAGEHRTDHSNVNVARGLFPIMVDQSIVACLDTGPLKVGAFSAAETKQWIKQSSLKKTEVQSLLAAVPVLSAKQVGRVFTMYRSLAAGFADRLRLQGASAAPAPDKGPMSSPLTGGLSRHYHKLLSVLLGYGSMLNGRDDLPEDVQDSIERMMTTASQGKALSELLFDEDWERSGLQETSLHDVIGTLFPLIDAHRSGSVRLEPELLAQEHNLFCRRNDLHQMLFELLSLGLDLAPVNSVVTLHTEQSRSPDPDSDRPGIALRLFDAARAPFDEAAAHLTLGLSAFGPVDDVDIEARLGSLVRRVQSLGGTFKVQPQMNSMTALEVVLPVERSEAAAPSPSAPQQMASTIWVVDDDPVFCAVCEDILLQAGHHVAELRGVEDTQSLWLAGTRPDLLVLDYTLEDGDGSELQAWIDEQVGGPGIPIIHVTSLASTHPAVGEMLERSKTYFLSKPLQRQELLNSVSVALGLTLVG